MRLKKWLMVLGILAALGLLIQLIPYGRSHTNPAVVAEPKWDSPTTRTLMERACFDCHSNQSVWPWYANIAPASWLVQFDVERGRNRLNFSEWGQGRQSTSRQSELFAEIKKVIGEGEMPPFQYLILHPSANLSTAERSQLLQGLSITLTGK
jgi:mono/diheme cytochrome c family protein